MKKSSLAVAALLSTLAVGSMVSAAYADTATTQVSGCKGCTGCKSCSGCKGCAGCKGCKGCTGCKGCAGCKGN